MVQKNVKCLDINSQLDWNLFSTHTEILAAMSIYTACSCKGSDIKEPSQEVSECQADIVKISQEKDGQC